MQDLVTAAGAGAIASVAVSGLVQVALKAIDAKKNNGSCRFEHDDILRSLADSNQRLSEALQRLTTLQEQMIDEQREARREVGEMHRLTSRVLDAVRSRGS